MYMYSHVFPSCISVYDFYRFCFVNHVPSIVVCMHLLNNCSWNGDDGRSSCYHTVKSLITLNFVYRNSDGGGGGGGGGGRGEVGAENSLSPAAPSK